MRLDEAYDLPGWSRTLAGWRERFVLPLRVQLPLAGPVLEIRQLPVASATHAKEACSSADGLATGSTVWDAGLVLAHYLYVEYAQEKDRKLSCIDLGSGTGIVGLAAAASGAFQRVVLTDMQSVLPLTQANRDTNALPSSTVNVVVMPLKWDSEGDLKAVSADGSFDLVMGGDLLYRPQVVEPLLCALRKLVGQHTRVLLSASIQHSPETLRLFVQCASKFFHISILPFSDQHHECASEEVRVLRLLPLKKTFPADHSQLA